MRGPPRLRRGGGAGGITPLQGTRAAKAKSSVAFDLAKTAMGIRGRSVGVGDAHLDYSFRNNLVFPTIDPLSRAIARASTHAWIVVSTILGQNNIVGKAVSKVIPVLGEDRTLNEDCEHGSTKDSCGK